MVLYELWPKHIGLTNLRRRYYTKIYYAKKPVFEPKKLLLVNNPT